MTVGADSLGDVAALATALGLLDARGNIDTTWFSDPGGHVTGMLRNQGQRDALAQFIQDALEDQTAPVTDNPLRTWVPLLKLTDSSDLFLVLEPTARGVTVSIGVRISVTNPVSTDARLRVPLLRVNQSPAAGISFLPGLDSTDAGDIGDATAELIGTVTVSDATLDSVGVTASVPLTVHGGGLSGTPAVGIVVRGLKLPGADAPMDVALDSSSSIGPELTHLLIAIVQAETASVTGAAHDLLGLLGIESAGAAIPPLPVSDLLDDPGAALRSWLNSVAGNAAALQAWVALLANLVGGTAIAGPPYGITLPIGTGGAALELTVDVKTDDAGGNVITPAVAISQSTSPTLRAAADVQLADISLGAHPGVRALPSLQLTARYGADTGTIVDVTTPAAVSVGALHAGLALGADRRPVFVLGAERVDIGPDAAHLHHHDVLDLTSPDALADVGAQTLASVVSGMLSGLGPAAAAVEVLIGLAPPASHAGDATWPVLSPTAFVADPVGALGAFLRDVIAKGPSDFQDLLGELPGLLGLGGTVTGNGTQSSPWTLELAAVSELVVWQDGTPTVLYAGLRAAPAIAPLGGAGGPTLGIAVVVEGLSVTLPPAGVTSTPLPVSVSALPHAALEVSLTGPISVGTGYAFAFDDFVLRLGWSPTSGFAPAFALNGATITVDGTSNALPAIAVGPGSPAVLPLGIPWGAIEQALAAALAEASAEWLKALPGLLGLGTPAFDAAGGLQALLTDPLRTIKTLLSTALTGPDATAFIGGLARSLQALIQGTPTGGPPVGPAPVSASALTPVAGTGTPGDPFALQLGTGGTDVRAVLWLDPEGPPVDAAAVTAVLEPASLSSWLDGAPGATTLTLDEVVALLEAAALVVPTLGGLMAGRTATAAAGLNALATRVTGGDGLLPGSAADVAGATQTALAGITHAGLPAALDLARVLGAAPDLTTVVHVTGPLEAPWSGMDARTFDLTAAGLAATAFDVSRAGSEDGPWHVKLAARAACPGASADAQLQAQTARLQRVVDAVAAHTHGQVVLVAHGSAGQAARLLASQDAAVGKLVLLGVPPAGLSLDVLDVPPEADALQLLRRLLPPVDGAHPDSADLAIGRGVIDTLGSAFDSALAPVNDFLAPPTLGALTPAVFSVRGELDGTATTRALAAVIRTGLAASLPGAAGARPAPTALRGGLRITTSAPPATAGAGPAGVAVTATATLDFGRLSLTGGPAPAPSLGLTISLSRPGGWLVSGPQGTPAQPDVSRTPSLRRAGLQVIADLGATPGVRAQIALDEIHALSLVSPQLVIGDGAASVTPEARVLLGRLADALGPPPAGSLLAGVVDLLGAAGLTDGSVAAPAVGLSVDAITRLAADPAGQLRGALSAAPARAQAAAALRTLFGDGTSTGTQAAFTEGGVTFALDLGTPTATLHVSTAAGGLALPAGLTLSLDTSVDAQGHFSGSGALTAAGGAGPAGSPSLRIAAGPTVTIHVEGGVPGLPSDLQLWPLTGGTPVAGLVKAATALFGGLLARDLLAALRARAGAVLDPLLTALALLDGTGAGAELALPSGLIADPGGWLARSLEGSGLDPDKVATLIDTVRELSGLPPAAHGTLPLPYGIDLTAGPGSGAPGPVRLGLDLDTTAGDLKLGLTGGLTLRDAAAPLPALSISVGPTSSTAALQLTLSGSSLGAALHLSNGNTIPLYPSGPGLGSLASAAVTAALPLVLDQLEAHAPAPVPAVLSSARTVVALGAAQWDGSELSKLARDPTGELERRLAAYGPHALATLLPLVQPALPAGWTADTSNPQAVTLTIGAGAKRQQLTLTYSLSPAAFSLAVTSGYELAVGGVGIVGTAAVTVDGSGLNLLDARVGIDPAQPLTVGPAPLAPFARVLAGAGPPGGARAEAGLSASVGGHLHSLVTTVLLGPPVHISLGTETGGTADGTPDIGAIVTGFVIPSLADVALADPSVQSLLAKPALHGATVEALLQNVLLTGGGPHFDPHALDLSQALNRLLTLGGNIANANPTVTIADHLTLEVAHVTSGATTTYGVGITVDPGQRVALNSGDVVLSIEVDSTWTDILPAASPGLTVLLLDDTNNSYAIAASPSVVMNGVGLRVARASGPLLDTGLKVGSVAVYGLLDIDAHGVQAAGGKLELSDLGVAVAGASGGENGVAQGVLGNAASGGGGSGDNAPLRPQFSPSLALEKPAGGALKWSLRAGDGNGPWWINIQRSFGPLHIEQIGFGVDQDGSTVHGLRVLLDGGLSLLGLSIEVEELSVGAQWPLQPSDPPLTDPHAWSIDLSGLAVGYSGGGVSLAGALSKRGSPPDYIGVLIAHLGPYGLTAFGGYGQFLAPDGSKYTSLFVVAGITAPIGGPPAFFVTGLGGGAGINRQLVFPATLDDFPNFPLVAALDPHSTLASDPQHAIDDLSAAFPPERGNFWFAAGVSFTSFALVDVTAVIAVSVGDGFQLALLGLGRMGLPTPYAPLVQVELALEARFSTKEGLLLVQAQLTQNSWLLTSDCRLTGGFAYASFFGPNPNAGQFVLTIGGYHPSFHHDGYPVVPRVGYVWSVASVLTISGQSYFALTSEALMAGTRFTAALDLGFLWASLTLGIDAIVYFDPFKFIADGYASIAAGVSIDIDLGFFGTIHISLSFHLGATVHVEGPDFHGSATIDLDVTSATISFGSTTDNSTHQLSWSDFEAKYLTAGGASALSGMPQTAQVTGTPTTSAGTTPTGNPDKPWKFVAEWSLSIATTAAATQLQLTDSLVPFDVSEVPGIASMNVDVLTSTLTVTVTGSAGGDPSPKLLGPGDQGEGLRVSLVTSPLPKGVWKANPNDQTVPSGDTITAGSGFVLQAPATVEGASPEIATNQIEPPKGRKPLPFVQETAARPLVVPDDTNAAAFAAAQSGSADAALASALKFLQAGPLGAMMSPMEVAAFGRGRVAPPKLGLLTEGMVSPVTPAPALTPILTPPPPMIDTSLHPPVLVGVLRGGPAPAQRPIMRTSVVDTVARLALAARAGGAGPAPLDVGGAAQRVPRVKAPTLASVGAELDPALAAQLVLRPPTAQVSAAGLRAPDGGPVSLRAATPGELRATAAVTPAESELLQTSTQSLLADGLTLRPGDLVVAELPNSARDLDPGHPRHTVSAQGDAAVRVIALTVTGRVLADVTGTSAETVLPQHTARVALWCVGGDGTRPAGLAGWCEPARLPQVGAQTLLGSDALITGVRHARRGPAAVSAAMVPAAAAVAGSRFTTTRLPADMRVLVIGLDPLGDARDLSGLTLGLDGATRATGVDGAPAAPTVVSAGTRTYLIYAIVPAATTGAVEVTVGTGPSWQLVGVLGAAGDVASTATQLAARGAAALAAPLIRAPVGSARVSWNVPGPGNGSAPGGGN